MTSSHFAPPAHMAHAPAAQLTFERREIKYLLDPSQRSALERLMAQHMEPDPHGAATVCNVYYDTPTLLMARRSADRPRYKEKLRTRSYGVASPEAHVFVEIKKKYAGVVYKRRASMAPAAADALLAGHGAPTTQIERELDAAARRYEGLAPRAFVAYDRNAYFSPDDHEFRMTFDALVRARWDRLTLTDAADGAPVLDPGLSVLEVKCLGGMPLWLVDYLSQNHIYKTSCSKYGSACRQRLAAARA